MYEFARMLNQFSSVLKDDDASAGVLLELFSCTGLSYTELARRAEVSRSMTWDVLHNKKKPTITIWARIAEVLSAEIIEQEQ